LNGLGRVNEEGRIAGGGGVGTDTAETGGTKTTAETGGTAKMAGRGTGWTKKPMDQEMSESDEDQTSSWVKGRSSEVETPNKDATNEGAWGDPPRPWCLGTAALP
jgi:hypothetical protein